VGNLEEEGSGLSINRSKKPQVAIALLRPVFPTGQADGRPAYRP